MGNNKGDLQITALIQKTTYQEVIFAQAPIIGIACKTKTKIADYTDAIAEFGGDPRPFVSLTDPIPERLPWKALRESGEPANE